MTVMTDIQTASGNLTAKEIQQYRNIIKTSVVLIILWRLGRPSGATELAKILGISRETTANYLESLNMTGFITRSEMRGGYHLTDDGRQLMLQVPGGYMLEETLRTSEIPTFIDVNYDRQEKLNVGNPDVQILENEFLPDENARTSEIPTLNVGNPDVQTGSIRLMIDESINLIDKQSSINPKENFPTCAKLLDAMMTLFGDALSISEIPADTPPKLLLAWIVKAYGDRDRIASPLGLIRARLKARSPRSLPKDWQERLPGDYLREIGIEPPPELFTSGTDAITASVEKWLGRRIDV